MYLPTYRKPCLCYCQYVVDVRNPRSVNRSFIILSSGFSLGLALMKSNSEIDWKRTHHGVWDPSLKIYLPTLTFVPTKIGINVDETNYFQGRRNLSCYIIIRCAMPCRGWFCRCWRHVLVGQLFGPGWVGGCFQLSPRGVLRSPLADAAGNNRPLPVRPGSVHGR